MASEIRRTPGGEESSNVRASKRARGGAAGAAGVRPPPLQAVDSAGIGSRFVARTHVQALQSTLGNRATAELLSQHAPPSRPVPAVQRLVVSQATLPDLTADLDTGDLEAAKTLVDTLSDRGKRQALAQLYANIVAADKHEDTPNNKSLISYLDAKLQATPGAIPENATSGWSESLALSMKYWTQSATDQVVQAGLRMWVTGDTVRGLNWNMIGKHLRGRLVDGDYDSIGIMHYMLEDRKNSTNLRDTYSRAQRIQAARGLLDATRGDIRGALDALPDHDGLSYRQAGVASSSVYGGLINVGDYIRDTTFWSTSALRISGSAGTWGEDGTKDKPKVYFIVNGTTGKYIAKYSGQEQGQHEVLFKDLVTFQVTKIANFRNETFFVHVTEVDPAAIPPGNAPKSPYTGL